MIETPRTVIPRPIISPPGGRSPPKKPEEPKITFPWFESKRKGGRKMVGYQALVKSGGIWKKISSKPMTFKGARDIGSLAVDVTTARSFKVVPITEVKREFVAGRTLFRKTFKTFSTGQLEKGTGYFEQVSKKLRPFRVIQGRKVPTGNVWIEKNIGTIDTLKEKMQLKSARERKKNRFRLF